MRSRLRDVRWVGVAAAAALAAAVSGALAEDTPVRLPVPAAADLKAAEGVVNEVYKTDLAAAKTPEAKEAICRKMMTIAPTEKGATGRYALWVRARELAAEAGDFDAICEINENVAQDFDVAGPKATADFAFQVSKIIRTPEQEKKFLSALPRAVHAAIMADDYDAARRLGITGNSVVEKLKDPALSKDVLALNIQIREADAAFTDAKAAVAALAATPEDAGANYKAGRYKCYYKSDWEKGLPELAKGSDPAGKQAAEADLAGGKSAEEQIAIGDAWWDIATKQPGVTKLHGAVSRGEVV